MFKTNITTSISLFAFTTLGLAACDPDLDAELGYDVAEESEEAEAALDITNGASASALARIGANFQLLDVAALELSETPMSPDEARELVAGVEGVGLDFAAIDPAAITDYKPLADAAMELGVPMILENIDDSQMLAELIGAGIEGEVAMVTSLGPNRYQVRVYGGGEASAFFESETGEISPVSWTSDNISLAVDEFSAALVSGPKNITQHTIPASTTGYKYYNFDSAEESYSMDGGDQIASLSEDFEMELVLDSARNMKNVFIRPIGSGQNPGTLISNSSSKRGYYQESQEVSITPDNSNVTLYKHAPVTPNSSSTYTSSTGWTIGFSGDTPEVSWSSSNESTTTLDDFSMVNNTSGATASWRFYMSKSWSSMFTHDFMQKCTVDSLPALAKSNLFPEFEAIYRASDTFTSTVNFTIEKETLLRSIRRGGDIFTCKKYSTLYTAPRDHDFAVNFGAV